ncbi:DUF4176 domain-containing protein [Paenibacillus sp. 2KB_20]
MAEEAAERRVSEQNEPGPYACGTAPEEQENERIITTQQQQLPNGSIVILKEGKKKLVIYGLKQILALEQPQKKFVGFRFFCGSLDII